MNKKGKINKGVMLLNQKEVRDCISIPEVIKAVETAYSQFTDGKTLLPPIINMMMDDRNGEIDVKTSFIPAYNMAAVKVASGFYQNETLYGIPSWPSIIILLDGDTGYPCAVMDGGYITTVRTGAAGAVGAKYLARKDSETVLIVGAGNQARIQLRVLLEVMPCLRTVYVYSPYLDEVERYVTEMEPITHLPITGLKELNDLAEATQSSDIIITVTPSHKPLILRDWVRPGTHINAIGSDGPGKQELDPRILRDAKVVADCFKQTALVGECQHAIKAGYMETDGKGLWAEIGEIVNGKIAGRENSNEITVFDATGMGVLDVAAATIVYERSLLKESISYFQMTNV